jgi:hypothetical protein
MVGPLINTMPVRTRVAGEAEPTTWLRDLQLRIALAREHGHGRIPELRALTGVRGDQPLFETLVNVVHERERPRPSGPVSTRLVEQIGRTGLPMTVTARIGPGGLGIAVEFERSRFDRDTVVHLTGALLTAVRNLATGSDRAVEPRRVPGQVAGPGHHGHRADPGVLVPGRRRAGARLEGRPTARMLLKQCIHELEVAPEMRKARVPVCPRCTWSCDS